MADPRAKVKFDEIAVEYLTMKIDNSTIVYDSTKKGGCAAIETGNSAVTISAAATVALCAADDYVLGKLVRVNSDLFATVQISGACTFIQGNAVTTTPGKRFAGALGPSSAKGYIKNVADAATPTATEVNNLAQKGRGIILDNSDTAAVAVLLD